MKILQDFVKSRKFLGFDQFFLFFLFGEKMKKSAIFLIYSGAKEYESDRSRKMLKKNEHLLTKFGVDTEENEPKKVSRPTLPACPPPPTPAN